MHVHLNLFLFLLKSYLQSQVNRFRSSFLCYGRRTVLQCQKKNSAFCSCWVHWASKNCELLVLVLGGNVWFKTLIATCGSHLWNLVRSLCSGTYHLFLTWSHLAPSAFASSFCEKGQFKKILQAISGFEFIAISQFMQRGTRSEDQIVSDPGIASCLVLKVLDIPSWKAQLDR